MLNHTSQITLSIQGKDFFGFFTTIQENFESLSNSFYHASGADGRYCEDITKSNVI